MSSLYPHLSPGGVSLPVSSVQLSRDAAERHAQLSAAHAAAKEQVRPVRRPRRLPGSATHPA